MKNWIVVLACLSGLSPAQLHAQRSNPAPVYSIICTIEHCEVSSDRLTVTVSGNRKVPFLKITSFYGEVDPGFTADPMAINAQREHVRLKPTQASLYPEEWRASPRGARINIPEGLFFDSGNVAGLLRHYDRATGVNNQISVVTLLDRLDKGRTFFVEGSLPRDDVCCTVRAQYTSKAFTKAVRKAISKL
ncbi:MAG: hypothetical protein ABI810_16375 [Sphingomonas bacterium]